MGTRFEKYDNQDGECNAENVILYVTSNDNDKQSTTNNNKLLRTNNNNNNESKHNIGYNTSSSALINETSASNNYNNKIIINSKNVSSTYDNMFHGQILSNNKDGQNLINNSVDCLPQIGKLENIVKSSSNNNNRCNLKKIINQENDNRGVFYNNNNCVTNSVNKERCKLITSISVPYGWKRIHSKGSIVYVSPSNTALASLDQLKCYLLTEGTCKCGLECPLQCDTVFNFDPKVATRPWSSSSESSDINETTELTKHCNHKRKNIIPVNEQEEDIVNTVVNYESNSETITSPALKQPVTLKKYSFDIGDRRKRRKLSDDLNNDNSVIESNIMENEQCDGMGDMDNMCKESELSIESLPKLPYNRIQTPPQRMTIQPSPNMIKNEPQMDNRMMVNNMMGQSPMNIRLRPPYIHHGGPYPNQFNNGQPQQQPQPNFEYPNNCFQGNNILQYRQDNAGIYTGDEYQSDTINGYNECNQGGNMMNTGNNMMLDHHNDCGQQLNSCSENMGLGTSSLHHHQQHNMIQQPNNNTFMQNHHNVQRQDQNQQTMTQQQMMYNSCMKTNMNHQENNMCRCYHQDHQMNNQDCMQDCNMNGNNNMMPQGGIIHDHNNMMRQQYNQYSQMLHYHHNDNGGKNHNKQQINNAQMQQQRPNQFQYQPRLENVQNFNQDFYNNSQCNNRQMRHHRSTAPWQQRTRYNHNVFPPQPMQVETAPPSPYERVPPLHHHMPPTPSNNEGQPLRKGYTKNNPTSPTTRHPLKKTRSPHPSHPEIPRNDCSHIPSFMEDPSGYLAQQTAMLHNTISKQAVVNPSLANKGNKGAATGGMYGTMKHNRQPPGKSPPIQKRNSAGKYTQARTPDSSVPSDCKKPIRRTEQSSSRLSPRCSRVTPEESPIVSSTYLDREHSMGSNSSSDSRSPIQAGTVSTSHKSPVQPGLSSPSVTGNPHSSGESSPAVTASTPGGHESDTAPSPKIKELPPRSIQIGRYTYGNDTITSVTAGKTNTLSISDSSNSIITSAAHVSTKSPLEMVRSVVSSIQVPPNSNRNEPKVVTSLPQNIQSGHLLLSSNGQLVLATSNNPIAEQKTNQPMTFGTSGMIPTMTPQVLSQPTMYVNTLPNGQLVLQPSVMMDGMQIPQITVANNGLLQTGQTISDSGAFSPRNSNMHSPDASKRKIQSAKKRRLSPQVMIAQQTSPTSTASVVVQPQQQSNFTQPQMLQTIILPSKTNQFGTAQPLIATANVLQPVNLVQNFPTLQQFLVPTGLGGMAVMTTGDGTATLLPEALQLNVLAPMQSTGSVLSQGQSILTATPTAAGMVLRAQPTTTAQMRQPFLQTSNQFIVNNSNFGGQLSPIVASVSPQTFNTSNNIQSPRSSNTQEYIQCGQTLIPCSSVQSQNTTNSPNNNTTVVQQNTTIVQQQMTMVSNNQSEQQQHHHHQMQNQHNIILNNDNNEKPFIITTDGGKQGQNGNSYAILSPEDKTATRFILNNVNSEKQSFIINPTDCGNFIITNNNNGQEAKNSGNFIISNNNQSRFAKQSVSTQTAAASTQHGLMQISPTPTTLLVNGSPPDTTTHSPLGHSPDTPSSSVIVGSTDDISSSNSPNQFTSDVQQTRQPMVHCISSSNVVDWSDNTTIDEKKLNIIVDRGGSGGGGGAGSNDFIDMFQLQQQCRMRSNGDNSKENTSYLHSSRLHASSFMK